MVEKTKGEKKGPYMYQILKKLAPKVGAKVFIEPEWRRSMQIVYNSGVVRYARYYMLDLNGAGSSKIAKDKHFAKFFMEKFGYPVASGQTFFSNKLARVVDSKRTINQALVYARKAGYPLAVKPNSKSQGVEVSVVWSDKDLKNALKKVFIHDEVALIEEYMPGRDYRVVVLDGEIISAYERVPLSVVGDGSSSILKLLENKKKILKKLNRSLGISIKDSRILLKLKRQGLNFKSIPLKDQKVFLLDNANLSTGGDSLDVTHTMHESFKKISIDLTRDMGLRMAGVDIMVRKGDITDPVKKDGYFIIEINSAPGLDHYVTTGKAQKKIVEDMYLKVLIALGKKD